MSSMKNSFSRSISLSTVQLRKEGKQTTRVTKSAVGNKAKFTGDLRTHLMAIDPEQVGQFTEDGKFALSQLGLDFACKSCHVAGGTANVYTDAQLIKEAKGYHLPN